ncbi:MAG: hypothetical protein ACOY9Y_08920 [Bacillota bacterium]
MKTAFDNQVMQKILPKLNGNAAKLEEPLKKMLELLDQDYPKSAGKISRMLRALEGQGFTSFIE